MRFRTRLTAALCLALSAAACGCGTKTVLVPPGVPVRLAEPADVRVYVRDESGAWVKGSDKVTVPAGWYALPPPATRPAK
jgi:hypothetical protein